MFSPIQFPMVIYLKKKNDPLTTKTGQSTKQTMILCALRHGIEVYMLELSYFMQKAVQTLIYTFQNPCTH